MATTTNKRKPNSNTALLPHEKRSRKNIINDQVAISIFEELGLDQKFLNCGKVLAWGLPPDDPDFLRIHDYFEKGFLQSPFCRSKIQSILRIIPTVHTFQNGDVQMDFENDPNVTGMKRMMLWHGTKRYYLKSILQNGLRLPKHGGLYGAGIYFADNISTSFVFTDWGTPHQYLLLCDVLLGNIYKANFPNSLLRKPPPMNLSPWWKIFGQQQLVPCQSVMHDSGCGPCPSGNVTIDGCTWPLGNVPWWGVGLFYNEYVVYDVQQVRPKFLVKVQ